MHWITGKLSDLVEINPPIKLVKGKEYPFVSMDVINPGKKIVEAKEYRNFSGGGSRFQNNDTLFARITPCLENGKISQVRHLDGEVGFGSTEFLVFRGKQGITDTEFVYYFVTNHSFRLKAIQLMVGTSGRQRVDHKKLSDEVFTIPPLPIQRRIAEILGSLDDKIELNRRMNETLEQMAMALYKHWFVDFGPFQDGESDIPQGWEYSPIEKLISEIESGDWGADKWTEKTPHQVICIRGTDIPQVRTGNDVKAPLRFIKQKSFEKKTLKPGDIVLEASGGSPSQSTGRPVLITKGIISRFNVPLTCSNFCKIIRPSSKNFSYYLYLHFMDSYEQNVFFSYENGTTGIKNLDINSYIKQNYIAIPPINIIDEFNQAVEDLFEQIQRNAIETDYLKETRDYLLPRLLSGEIEVREAEEQVEEVLAHA